MNKFLRTLFADVKDDEFLHLCSKDTIFNPNMTYEQDEYFFKPNGLWMSPKNTDCDFTWIEWLNSCDESETFCEETFKNSYGDSCLLVVKINMNKILQLKTIKEMIAFTEKYRKKTVVDYVCSVIFGPADYTKLNLCCINWQLVVDDGYDGIAIVPYQESLHFNLRWYNPWDCSSMCVWNLKCVENVRKINFV